EDSRRRHDRTPALPDEEQDERPRVRSERYQLGPRLGNLPLARRDLERLRHLLLLQRRLRDLGSSPRAKRALIHRSVFREARAWLEIHGGQPDTVEHWKALLAESGPSPETSGAENQDETRPVWRRRRRRRRFRPTQ